MASYKKSLIQRANQKAHGSIDIVLDGNQDLGSVEGLEQ